MRLLVFGAHSADFCSCAGGTIAKYVRDGAQVRVISLSYGERSESGGLYSDGAKPSLEEIKVIRCAEATRAARILGAEIGFLGWGDLGFDYSIERAGRLTEEIRAFCPDAIITPHGPDPRSVDRDTTWRLVMRASQLAEVPGLESEHRPLPRPPVFCFEATVPLTELEGFNPDFYVDITDVWGVKTEALKAFRRGQSSLLPRYTDVARHRGFQAQHLTGRADVVYAEAFERTSPWVGRHLPLNEI